jgi:hypothetical protein
LNLRPLGTVSGSPLSTPELGTLRDSFRFSSAERMDVSERDVPSARGVG